MIRFKLERAIPFMVSDAGELVCVPRTTDPPTMAFLGAKGGGKTLAMKGVCDRSYCTYTKDSFMFLNDYMNESPHWLGKQDNKKFIKLIESIGDRPAKLPFIPIYPNHKYLKVDKDLPYYYKFGLPFDEFIKNLGAYFDTKRSLVYFKNIQQKILDLKIPTIELISNIIKEGIKEKSMPKESGAMLMGMITSFFIEERLDIEKDTIGKVELKDGNKREGIYDLISGLAYARRIPVLMTKDIIGKEDLQPFFASILKTIFKNQGEGFSDKYGKVLHSFVDEIGLFINKNKPTPCTKILNEFVAQGRPARIAFYYATQNPSKLSDRIKTNTKYTVCFGLDRSEVKYVNEITPFSKRIKDIIPRLGKGEIIANTPNEEWLFINPYKKRDNGYRDSGVVKGKMIYPLSSTAPPIRGGQ